MLNDRALFGRMSLVYSKKKIEIEEYRINNKPTSLTRRNFVNFVENVEIIHAGHTTVTT